MESIQIGKERFTKNGPLYFIADIGANHDGSLEQAFKLIELAKESGAHAAKFQNFSAEKIVSKKGFEDIGQLSHQASWKKPVVEVYKDASIPHEWTIALKQKCEEVGIDYFTSAYDFEAVDFVDPYVDIYKIGSGDITWVQILEHIATKNKPVIIASGASELSDVERAMAALTKKTDKIVLMQCNTNYTGSDENFKYINLNVLKKFREMYPDVILGLSDHTPGHATVLGAIALGATFIEKHFTDDNNKIGPDHKFAMNPTTWKEMVQRSAEVFLALGDGEKRIEANETKTVMVQRRALRYTAPLQKGHTLTADDVFPLRPYAVHGLHPYEIGKLIGKRLVKDVDKDQLTTLNDFEQ
ncbi:N-acetylneuraminate synthase family protein [Panacibacter sp. DH6]|uniref:N-acetylneuraminate synthase family protein n=1 Tax=Panacibacter microcysteis TaxID=2793269 RepID=A0A931E5N8_9BACT|nr:N-acetylneuraminate synthase family protein [Panacibacter microcysteis]MBG9375740.1 N-acetylneuraminate synthase family protein [Panacibacter microcysteis]